LIDCADDSGFLSQDRDFQAYNAAMIRPDGAADRYETLRVLGEGGAGRVLLVRDRLRPGPPLALKEPADPDPRRAEQIVREFAILSTLHHPNLVEVYELEAGDAERPPRFTQEWIAGLDLVEALAEEGPGAFVPLAAEALRALGFLHDFDLIHRDVKPKNLLVRHAPRLGSRLVLLDFDLALREQDDSVESLRAKGTLPYMAPEIFAGGKADRRSDLYGLGAVLYEAVHRRPPFVLDADDLGRFLRAVREGRRPRPPLPPGYPEGLGVWLEELLDPDPERRPQSAGEALARLNQVCGTSEAQETTASRAARLGSGPPVGRDAVIGHVRERLDPERGPALVWLRGGPGSGKTRLLRWLAAELLRDGWAVVGPDADLEAEALAQWRARAADGPAVALLDDVEAGVSELAELLDRVAREPEGPPVQVVAGLGAGPIRNPLLARLVADSGTVPTLRRIDLDPLDEEGLRALAARATGGAVSDERVAWLRETSGGDPAVAETLLVEGRWESGPRETAVGAGGKAAGRIGMLSRPGRRWLETLAVVERPTDEALLAGISGLDPDVSTAAAAEAAAAGLAHVRGGRWVPHSRHMAAQVRAGLEPATSAELHRRAAEALDRGASTPGSLALLARLWDGAGMQERAIDRALAAAESAAASGDPAAAAAAYAHALSLMPGREARRHDARIEQGRALTRSGMHAGAVRALGAAARLARDPASRARALAQQAGALVRCGRFGRAAAVAERAAVLAREGGDRAALAASRRAAGIVLGRLGRETEALPLLEEAIALSREEGDRRGEADAAHAIGICRLRLGRAEAAVDFERAIAIYRDLGDETVSDVGSLLKARVGLAMLHARGGRFDEARAVLESVGREAGEHGNLDLRETAQSKLAQLCVDQGRLDRAIELSQQAADLALHLGDANLILVDHARLADALVRCGRPGDAVALLRETLDRPLERVEPDNVDYVRMLLADAWMQSGSSDERSVRSLMERTLRSCRERRAARPLLMALAIEMERRALPDSDEPFAPVSEEFEASAAAYGAAVDPEIRLRAALARAAASLGRGDAASARGAAESAVLEARDRGALEFEVRARALLGEALTRLGREREAQEALAEARRRLTEAASHIEDEEVRAAFAERAVFEVLSEPRGLSLKTDKGRLLALYDMVRALNSERDPEALLETILDMALRAVQAERGMILLKELRDDEGSADAESDAFSIRLARNLEEETERDAETYSRRIVAAAGKGRSLLTIDAGADRRFQDLESVSLYGIRSLMCVPLRSRGSIIGTVYVDSRREGAMFSDEDLEFVEAFADQAALALENARAHARLQAENRRLQAVAETRTRFGNLIGRCAPMQAVFELIEKVAPSELPVLVQGESGTGKELVARAIHYHGTRRRRTFLSENCAAIPESLLESELFGHVRGAFTGAERDRPGLFEQADGGTLFLDEIGDMSAAMQAKLLRVLQEGEVRRVGGETPIHVDVRVLAATNRNLREEVAAGRFREDLLYRIQVLTIDLPPLRKRPGDVALLTAHLLRRIAGERGRPVCPVEPEALALFERYRWPGNVRELENTLQRLALLAGDGPITLDLIQSDPSLRPVLLRDRPTSEPDFSLVVGEKQQIQRALEECRGNRIEAARLLGVSRSTIYRKIKQHGL
jgi:Nif-specific regulatory protein